MSICYACGFDKSSEGPICPPCRRELIAAGQTNTECLACGERLVVPAKLCVWCQEERVLA